MCPRVASNGVTRVGRHRVDPVLVMQAVNQLEPAEQLPRELREGLVLFVGPRQRGVGARLAIVVAQILVPGEEPEPVANNRPAEARRQIAVSRTLVPSLSGGGQGMTAAPAGSSGRRFVRSKTLE